MANAIEAGSHNDSLITITFKKLEVNELRNDAENASFIGFLMVFFKSSYETKRNETIE